MLSGIGRQGSELLPQWPVMGDYHHFLSSMSGAGLHQGHGLAGVPPQAYRPGAMSMAGSPIQATHQSIGYFQAAKDLTMQDASKLQKSRKKSNAGLAGGAESVKHRRTRSGCFTCRSRRVKCDEKRPVCDRCQKGSRECVYPEPPSASKGGTGRPKDGTGSAQQSTSPMSSTGDGDDDFEQRPKLQTIPDGDEPDLKPQKSMTWPLRISTASANEPPLSMRQGSETPSQEENKSSSPSASTVTTGSIATATYQPFDYLSPSDGRPDTSHLPQDFQHYLQWYDNNVTHYHYCLNIDTDDFFKTILPSVAVQNEPLLNALVGFSAYHATLQNPNGKLEDFLQYYNRSVTLLLAFLKRKEKHNIATLLTILQLATIEEYLGDWVNLMGHQRAAFEIFTSIFSPQTAMQTPLGRMCLSWYSRFDNFVAIMGGFPTSLPREYFDAMVTFSQQQVASSPDNITWRFAEQFSRLRRISWDMSLLYARGCRGQIALDDFNQEHDHLTSRLIDWRDSCDPILLDPQYLVKDFGGRRPDPDDIVNPFEPGILYDFPLFPTTVIMAEWNSIMIMHLTQCSNKPLEQLYPDLSRHAYTLCRYFESIEYWPQTPKGVMTLKQSGVQISALFLPQDGRHQMWVRRKLAILENLGYIIPVTIRTKMSEMMGDPTCARWWLPNDEGFTPVLQSVRHFADERNATAVTVQQESVREVRHLFAKLEIDGQASPITDKKGKGRGF